MLSCLRSFTFARYANDFFTQCPSCRVTFEHCAFCRHTKNDLSSSTNDGTWICSEWSLGAVISTRTSFASCRMIQVPTFRVRGYCLRRILGLCDVFSLRTIDGLGRAGKCINRGLCGAVGEPPSPLLSYSTLLLLQVRFTIFLILLSLSL